MSFNWFSLDYIYYPVSGIMWLWYKLFGALLGAENFFAWGLSVMFLVFSLRALLYKPFVRQIETTRQMQELQPQIKELQKKYGKDRQRLALEMQKLQSEHGFNPLLGCLPMLAQIPVFLGLFHVLRSFNRTDGAGMGIGAQALSLEQNRTTGNYFFSATDVSHFLNTDLFGAPLGATMIQHGESLKAFAHFDRTSVILVGIPLMIISGIATHMNSRASVARQSVEAQQNPQTQLMNKLALYVFPLGVVVSGPFLPIAILMYWVANNIWTYGQQHVVFNRIEQREAEEKEQAIARRSANAPAPGVKPNRSKKGNAPAASANSGTDVEQTGSELDGTESDSAGSKPAPGAKPNKKKR